MSRLAQNPQANYPRIRLCVGTLPDGKRHVYIYGLDDSIGTAEATLFAESIERELNRVKDLEQVNTDLLEACEAVLAEENIAETIRAAKNPDMAFAAKCPEYAADCASIAEAARKAEAALAKARPTP
jgi:hypothetical protein